jgi:electron transfer flavoprotein alpha subunit
MAILVLAEHDHTSLKPATLSTIAAAKDLRQDIHLLILGNNPEGATKQAQNIKDLEKIIVGSNAALEKPMAETFAQAVLKIAGDYAYILAPATTFGKNILPRVAARLDVQQVSDVIKIESPTQFTHPIYAGNALETVETAQSKNVMTIRPTAFTPVKAEGGNVAVSSLDVSVTDGRSKFVSIQESKGDRPELTAAKIVISGGRGVGSKENFKIIEGLADQLKAAVGASRAAVDAGYVPNDYQVGQTGKIVAPNLYMAIGISGAIQHLAGMSGSKTVVAINKDPDAPIFQVADYGLVADLFTAIPALQEELKK